MSEGDKRVQSAKIKKSFTESVGKKRSVSPRAKKGAKMHFGKDTNGAGKHIPNTTSFNNNKSDTNLSGSGIHI